jgi:hypothetical protein
MPPRYLGAKPFGNKLTFGRKKPTYGFMEPRDPNNPGGPLKPASGESVLANAMAPNTPPVDPQFEAQKAAANRNIALGDAWDTYQTGRLNQSYGNLDNPAADLTSNPYSRAAALQNAYLTAKRQSLNSYAAQGQLYSGAYQNRTEDVTRGYNEGLHGLRTEKQDAIDQILKGGMDRYSQVGATVSDDQLRAILRALGA